MPEISVVISTYNRAQSLAITLESLLAQEFRDFEVLLVDNAGDAATEEAVGRFANQAWFPVRYERFPRGGLGEARNHGVSRAGGGILVFTDDDVSPAPGWLAAYSRRFSQHPSMSACGGCIKPLWQAPPPHWLVEYIGAERFFGPYALMEQANSFVLGPDVFFFGCNMALRSEIFTWTGFHPELYGTRTLGDGESGLNEDLSKAGALIGYEPSAVVHHRIGTERMSVRYIRKWAWHLSGSLMYQRWKDRERTAITIAREAWVIACEYSGCWAKCLFTGEDESKDGIARAFRASEGYGKIAYLYWMLRDPLVGDILDRRHFAVSPAGE